MSPRTTAILLLLAVASGCGGSTSATSTSTSTSSSTGDGGGGGGGGGGSGGSGGGGGPLGPGVAGIVADEGGTPVDGVSVLACTATFCLYGASAADGSFFFPFDPPVDLVIKTQENTKKTPRWAESMAPVHLGDMSLVSVGTIYIPTLPAGVPIVPVSAMLQTFKAGDNLELTLRTADLEPSIGTDLDDLAARAIPSGHRPAFAALGGEQVIDVFAIHPFAATSVTPIGVRIPCNLAAGTKVKFRSVDELDGHLSDPAVGHSDGTFAATDPGAGLTKLSWLVVSK